MPVCVVVYRGAYAQLCACTWCSELVVRSLRQSLSSFIGLRQDPSLKLGLGDGSSSCCFPAQRLQAFFCRCEKLNVANLLVHTLYWLGLLLSIHTHFYPESPRPGWQKSTHSVVIISCSPSKSGQRSNHQVPGCIAKDLNFLSVAKEFWKHS